MTVKILCSPKQLAKAESLENALCLPISRWFYVGMDIPSCYGGLKKGDLARRIPHELVDGPDGVMAYNEAGSGAWVLLKKVTLKDPLEG